MGNCCTTAPSRKVSHRGKCSNRWTKFWSCRCCSGSDKDHDQGPHAHFANGKVHLITKIEKWEEKISEANGNGKILVANFSASWCRPCRTIAPVYRELADTFPSITFVTVDVEELAEFSNEWNVEATPTIFFIKEGRQVDKLVGADKVELQKKTAAVADLAHRRPSS